MLSEVFEVPMVEIHVSYGGYVFCTRIPDGDDDRYVPHVCTDIDTMLAQIKKVLVENQHIFRVNSAGEVAEEQEEKNEGKAKKPRKI